VSTSAAEPLLAVENLTACYGKIAVVSGVSLDVGRAEAVTLLGPNGAGKTTLLRAISGLLPVTAGSVVFAGTELAGRSAREISRLGLAHVIEGHRIFTQQTVTDNLLLAGYDLPGAERRARIEEALQWFPELAARRHAHGSQLSGGQQQMLAVAQGLVRRPRLLLVDEPSAGLSPVLVDRVLAVLTQLTARGTSVLLVEQLVDKALAAANRVYVLAQGRVVLHAKASDPGVRAALENAYLGGEPRPPHFPRRPAEEPKSR